MRIVDWAIVTKFTSIVEEDKIDMAISICFLFGVSLWGIVQ